MFKENLEQQEISKDDALKIVNALKFDDYELFSYEGIHFLIILCRQDEIDSDENKEEVFFAQSTAIDGFDIYVLDSLSTEEKRRRVLHEVIEASLIKQGFDNKTAHGSALKVELDVFGKRTEKHLEK